MNNPPQPMDKTITYINNLYDDLSYFDQYFSSILLVIVITIFVGLVVAYCSVMKRANEIKNDWNENRCKPSVMPFAGVINKPADKTVLEFTAMNFEHCVQQNMVSNLDNALRPFNVLNRLGDAKNAFDAIDGSFNYLQQEYQALEDSMNNELSIIEKRLINLLIPIQKMMYVLKDNFARVQAILLTGTYTSLSGSMILKSTISESILFMIHIFMLLVIVLPMLSLFPLTMPIAAPMTAAVLTLGAIATPMFVELVKIFDIKRVFPKMPTCFDKNTKIMLDCKTVKNIQDIKVGDILADSSVVTATLVLDSKNEKMYCLNGIIVSGTHSVKYHDKWVKVKDHPDVVPVKNYFEKYLYCLNTTNKSITINNTVFCDWDEVFESSTYHKTAVQMMKANGQKYSPEKVHTYFDVGYSELTKVMCDASTGCYKYIKDIQIGDILMNNSKVYGLVKMRKDNKWLYNLLTESENMHILSENMLDIKIVGDYNSTF